ncbi:hypothetical protein ScPMuIL_018085 [Solemya velum]
MPSRTTLSTVFWRKGNDDFPLTIGKITYTQDADVTVNHREEGESITHWDLIIKNVKLKHAGVYECQISSIDSYAQRIQLSVINKPRSMPAAGKDINRRTVTKSEEHQDLNTAVFYPVLSKYLVLMVMLIHTLIR